MGLDTSLIQGSMVFHNLEGKSQMFKLKNMSFHAPSEHTLNGVRYDAELQIVHQEYQGIQLAVISILFDASKDISSCLFEKLNLGNLTRLNQTNLTYPASLANPTVQRRTNLKVPLKDYVERMGDSFYYYQGSLTIPPCQENVHWIVMSEVQYITLDQRSQLSRLWQQNPTFASGRGNNRVTQNLNNRNVYYRHVSLEEHFESLTNHFMLPEFGMQLDMMCLISKVQDALASVSDKRKYKRIVSFFLQQYFIRGQSTTNQLQYSKLLRLEEAKESSIYIWFIKRFVLKSKNISLVQFINNAGQVYLENQLPQERNVPGPGQYEPIKKLGENALKLTIGTKTVDPKTLTSQKFVPGPGTYEPKNSINQTGQFVLSNMKSTLTPSFSLPSLKQLPGRRLDYVEMMKYVPGPGQYTPKLDLGDKPVVSAFRQSIQPTLYNHDRFPRNDRNKNMPGPGYYQTISDFGIYGSPKNQKTLRTTSSLFSTKNSDNANVKKSQSFGASRVRERPEKDYKSFLKNQRLKMSENQTVLDHHDREMKEFIELDQIIRTSVIESAEKEKEEMKHHKKHKKFKYIGLSKQELRQLGTQQIIDNLNEEKNRLFKKYNIDTSDEETSVKQPRSQLNNQKKKHSSSLIDLGVFFQQNSSKVNEPFENFLQHQYTLKAFSGKGMFSDNNKLYPPRTSKNQQFKEKEYSVFSLPRVSIAKQTTKESFTTPKSPFLQQLKNSELIPSISILDSLTPTNINSRNMHRETSQLNAQETEVIYSLAHLKPFDARVQFLRPLSLKPIERQGSASGEPRSATLKKYDLYKQYNEGNLESQSSKRQNSNQIDKRNSLNKNALAAVQLIHDAVDDMKKIEQIKNQSPTMKEPSNKDLEQEINNHFKDMNKDKIQMSSKLQKKFNKRTIQTFISKKFDIEKEIKRK
ncbi:UNKNOWN [Stylonychia lemnae]|uniref:carbonic anhydrase n=1 Tax=Stylonychia lemnae TaxID=5949 RepID=A0A078A6C2_STYLE|nr:UNKNOWN [Stylonychia lemnae]|eukprot:CDW77125.1 UNKNOWN [Stylonychia lemnae]